MTYQQAQMLGAQIRKGKRGTTIVYAKPIQLLNKDVTTDDENTWTIPLLRAYILFNVDQIDGLPAQYSLKPLRRRWALISQVAICRCRGVRPLQGRLLFGPSPCAAIRQTGIAPWAFSATWPSWPQTGACLRLREEGCISRKSPASPELFAASTNQSFTGTRRTALDRRLRLRGRPRSPAIRFLAVGSLIESGNAMPVESPAGIPEAPPRF